MWNVVVLHNVIYGCKGFAACIFILSDHFIGISMNIAFAMHLAPLWLIEGYFRYFPAF